MDLSIVERKIKNSDLYTYTGSVSEVTGLMIESEGPIAKMGEVCLIYPTDGVSEPIRTEVVGFSGNKLVLMPLGHVNGIAQGCTVVATNHTFRVPVAEELVGRILDGLGQPIDNKGPVTPTEYYGIDNDPPDPLMRERITKVLPLGIKAIDGLLTCGQGQRLGIFAGSGVGKSTLLGMIARNAVADLNVITLVGERGREVRDFIEKDLKEEGLRKSVLIIATSDQPALVRVKAAMLGTSIAEYFRDKGKNVLFLMDSLTRFAMAQREVGMASGEPPVSRGYTPSVYAMLPRLLERTGNSSKGSITGLYTVLVDGDDMNEPISDTVRGILDGHIVLSRKLANRNHYPAIDVLASVSRVMPDIVTREHYDIANTIKSKMAVYKDAEDLINIGAYKKGANQDIDEAILLNKPIEGFLRQRIEEAHGFDKTVDMMREILRIGAGS
ncbi:MAG TPA: flagellar protein export ATPase FliI [Clostridia bacterium]|nr:flagellar protein export ATPase FliI [Clostridia bacterium]HPZ52186.1 flagellar protein export ATPase FliI [Clostridia bacterium]